MFAWCLRKEFAKISNTLEGIEVDRNKDKAIK